MRMMRERLLKLIKEAVDICSKTKRCDGCIGFGKGAECINYIIADRLLADGVIVPPCKVGDMVYVKWRLHRNSNDGIYPVKVYALRWDEKKNNFRVCVEGNFEISSYGCKYTHHYQATFAWNNFGKTVFLTREEAEKALKGE